MANITGASLRPIYDRLHDAPEYHPMEADTFADWALEAGDIVTITRDGNSYTSPVHNATTVWKKGQQVKVSSTGKEERENVTKQSQKKYNRGSSGLRNSRYQHIYVDDQYKQMQAGLYLTASSAFLYVDNRYTQMRAGLDLTSSSAHLYVDNKYSQMRAGLDLTSSSAHLYVDNKYSQMKSGLDLTSSSAHLYVDNKYSQMKSGLDLTSSSAHLYVDNKYSQMKSGLDLTSSSAHLYVDNKYSQMKSGLDLTSSSAHLYVDNKYSQMKSGLDLTSSSAHLYVDNKYSQMKAGLDLTSSSAHLYVDNKYSQMKAGLDLTSSSAHLYVDNKYSQMTAGLELSTSSAMLYARNRTTRAFIIARINADGEGEALIEADKVSITGATTINGTFEITDTGYVKVKKTMFCDGNVTLAAADGVVSAHEFNASGTGGFLRLWGSGSDKYDLDFTLLGSLFSGASVSGSTLTLTRVNGDTVTFSRAVSSWLWAGGNGNIQVTALPQNQSKVVPVSIDGRNTITSNGTYTYTVDYENADGDDVSTGATKDVTVSVGTDKGANWYCTIEQSGQTKTCRLVKTFGASQSVPFTNGDSYRLYTH